MSIFQLNGNNTPANSEGQIPSKAFDVGVDQTTAPIAGKDTPEGKDAVTPTGDNPTVILDGSLSRIYTQALNLVYANENIKVVAVEDVAVMAAMMEAEGRNSPSFKDNNAQKATYVYADNADAVDTEKCVAIINFINENKSKGDVILSLESFGKPTKHMQLVEECAKENKVKIFYSRGRALEAIRVSAYDKKA